MKKRFLRPVALLLLTALFGACVSPYQAQMGALHDAYRYGHISESEYHREMTRLHMADAGWRQHNANTAATAAAVGIAAVGAAALLDDHHHHHHRHRWHRHHRHHRGW